MTLFHKHLGQGPPLVILHGLFGSLDNWMSIAKVLSLNHTVYLVDLRNHGKSFHHSEFNYPVMSSDLKSWADLNRLNRFTLLGHSMGGKVAMHFTQDNYEFINKLLVIDIGPKAYPVHHQSILEGLAAVNVDVLNSRQEADRLLADFVPEAGVRQFLLKNLNRKDQGGFKWKLNLTAIRENITAVGAALPVLPAIRNHSLFLKGGASQYILEEDNDTIMGQFPNATIKTIAEAGHWIHAEAPQKFLEVVQEFLNTDN